MHQLSSALTKWRILDIGMRLASTTGYVRVSSVLFIEINIPNPPSTRVAAFFGRDGRSEDLFLLHDGKMGGGKEGVNRDAFLRYSGLQTISVEIPHRREAIIIGKLGDPNLADHIEKFVRIVLDFKGTIQ